MLWDLVFDPYGFSRFLHVLYSIPLLASTEPPVRPISTKKTFFSEIDYFAQGCRDIDRVFRKGPLGPERHPTMLVWPYSRYWRKYPNVTKYPHIVGQVRKVNEIGYPWKAGGGKV